MILVLRNNLLVGKLENTKSFSGLSSQSKARFPMTSVNNFTTLGLLENWFRYLIYGEPVGSLYQPFNTISSEVISHVGSNFCFLMRARCGIVSAMRRSLEAL